MSQQDQENAGAAKTRGPAEDHVVLYVAGSGRSGSTLLDRMLGQVPGVTAIGELATVWRPGELDKLVCGCGLAVRECPFWSAVSERAYGGWDSQDFRDAVSLHDLIRHRYLPLSVAPGLSPEYRRRAERFDELVRRTYAAIAEVAGNRVVVDSSKEVAFAYLLARAIGRKLRLLHLVRHGNGVAHSWTKAVAKPEVGNPDAQLPRYHPWRMATRWVGYNSLVDLLRLRGVATLPLRYESVVEQPQQQITRVLRHAGIDVRPEHLAFLDGSTAHLEPTHTVAGNPMRFRQGDVRLRLDEDWRTGMAPRDRIVVGALSSPLLLRFGYVGRRRRDRGPVQGRS